MSHNKFFKNLRSRMCYGNSSHAIHQQFITSSFHFSNTLNPTNHLGQTWSSPHCTGLVLFAQSQPKTPGDPYSSHAYHSISFDCQVSSNLRSHLPESLHLPLHSANKYPEIWPR